MKLEKNVPIPEVLKGRRSIWPLREMEVGDSFFVPADGTAEQRYTSQRIRMASRPGRLMGRRFKVLVVEGGVRCWRTK